jgi:ubiquinone biosynthesis protein UbiJ
LLPQRLLQEISKGLKAIERQAFKLKLPPALLHEVLDRVLIFINHVLLHEPQALQRLKRQHGRTLSLQWHEWQCRLRITRAGLLERDRAGQGPRSKESNSPDVPGALTLAPAKADLSIMLMETSVLDVASRLLKDEKPALRIEGDVQLAAEVNWLVDHVQWDYEDDLSKIVGDAYAHQVVRLGRGAMDALRRFAEGAYARASSWGTGVSAP